MSKTRKIATYTNAKTGKRAVVRRDAEWGEFQVVWMRGSDAEGWVAIPGATYHTDDRDDAIRTASSALRG